MWTSSPSRSTTTSASKRSSFLFSRKNGQLAREAQPLGRLLFFLEEKKQKKINCGKVISLPFCRFSRHPAQNGRFTYEPSVFSFQAGRAGNYLPPEREPPRIVFCFFSSRKENVPPLLFRRKTDQLARETQPLRRLLFFLEEKKQKKINCGKVISLPFCRFSRHSAQNGRFTYEPSVFFVPNRTSGELSSPRKRASPQCLLFLFFKKRKRTPFFLEEKKTYPPF